MPGVELDVAVDALKADTEADTDARVAEVESDVVVLSSAFSGTGDTSWAALPGNPPPSKYASQTKSSADAPFVVPSETTGYGCDADPEAETAKGEGPDGLVGRLWGRSSVGAPDAAGPSS